MMSVDKKVYALAEVFYADVCPEPEADLSSREHKPKVQSLAEAIQQTIEDWIEYELA